MEQSAKTKKELAEFKLYSPFSGLKKQFGSIRPLKGDYTGDHEAIAERKSIYYEAREFLYDYYGGKKESQEIDGLLAKKVYVNNYDFYQAIISITSPKKTEDLAEFIPRNVLFPLPRPVTLYSYEEEKKAVSHLILPRIPNHVEVGWIPEKTKEKIAKGEIDKAYDIVCRCYHESLDESDPYYGRMSIYRYSSVWTKDLVIKKILPEQPKWFQDMFNKTMSLTAEELQYRQNVIGAIKSALTEKNKIIPPITIQGIDVQRFEKKVNEIQVRFKDGNILYANQMATAHLESILKVLKSKSKKESPVLVEVDNGQYNYRASNGDHLLKHNVEQAEPFRNGRANVVLHGVKFEIDETGHVTRNYSQQKNVSPHLFLKH